MKPQGLTSNHTLIVGPSGSGKTATASDMLTSAIEEGRGVLCIGHNNDLVRATKDSVSRAERNDRVFVVDEDSDSSTRLSGVVGNRDIVVVNPSLEQFGAFVEEILDEYKVAVKNAIDNDEDIQPVTIVVDGADFVSPAALVPFYTQGRMIGLEMVSTFQSWEGVQNTDESAAFTLMANAHAFYDFHPRDYVARG